jgi:hypothetical protein
MEVFRFFFNLYWFISLLNRSKICLFADEITRCYHDTLLFAKVEVVQVC